MRLQHNISLFALAITLLVLPTSHSLYAQTASDKPFVHPGLLHSQADFDRMKAKVDAGAHPWIDSWNILIKNPNSGLGRPTNEVPIIYRGNDNVHGENYWRLMYDTAAAYQTAVRWKVSGDDRYADKSVKILNAWSSTLQIAYGGDVNASLAEGIYGYEIANAGEIMRGYKGWAPADFARFQGMMLKLFYPGLHDFLTRHYGTNPTRFWANWDLCNMASMLAIGVLCDHRDIYDEAITYFKAGIGNGSIQHVVYYMHPGYLGQWQESGRDQGHASLGVTLMGALCEMAWHQGDDLYGYDNNRVLAGMEYIAKYNLMHDVPFAKYVQPDVPHTIPSDDGRGASRPGWELVYNHYVNIKGIAAPYTTEFAAKARPEGGGGNYGPNSGGFDQLGFGTLTATLDPIAAGAPPSGLTATVSGSKVTLSWWGSAFVTNYIVRRAMSPKGTYSTLATVTDNTYTDTSVATGKDYFYKVVALAPNGKQLVSNSATALLSTQLIADYKFIAAQGTQTPDATGKCAAADLLNGANVTSDGGLSLNGTNQYAQLPNGIVDGLSDFSVSCWAKITKHNNWARVFDIGDDVVSSMFFTPKTHDGFPSFSITCAGGGGGQSVTGEKPFPLGVWTHVAVTLLDGTETLYINGEPVATKSGILYTPNDFRNTHRNFIGKSQYTDQFQSQYIDPYLDGNIADFRIYRGALSSKEIAALAAMPPFLAGK